MTKITLSTGDKYTIEAPAAEIMQAMNRDRWISLEDNGRDIRVRSSHIVAIEEDTAAIIKEAEREVGEIHSCINCGKKLNSGTSCFTSRMDGKSYCYECALRLGYLHQWNVPSF